MERFSLKVSVAYMDARISSEVSRQLKEELAWATGKQLQVISNIMLFKTVIPLRN